MFAMFISPFGWGYFIHHRRKGAEINARFHPPVFVRYLNPEDVHIEKKPSV